MKQFKINEKNEKAVADLLLFVNGRATQHTFAVAEVFGIARDAEIAAMALLGSKKAIVGAQAFMRSGGAVPNAYKYPREMNLFKIERRSSGWWIVLLTKNILNDKTKDTIMLSLTSDQAALATKRFQSQFLVRK
jgi:hypothetical protein